MFGEFSSAVGSPLLVGLAPLAMLAAEQARRIAQARLLARRAPQAFTRTHEGARRRVLIVGDSTGAGVGCEDAGESLAARLAGEFEDAEVVNLCEAGDTIAQVHRKLLVRELAGRWDLVLVFAGGNDVLGRTPWPVLRDDATRLLAHLQSLAAPVIWSGIANVGLAPLFLPPFSWWMTARTRRTNALLRDVVTARGGRFVDFFRERGRCRFAADPARYYARDGVHPSAQAYAWCYARLQPAIREALAG